MRAGAWVGVGAIAIACAPSAPSGTTDCTPGQTRCADALAVETCDATGHWAAPAACEGQTCVDGACAGECAVGATRCDGISVETCDASGSWVATETCPVACCDASCVDTATDTRHCGACGNACGAGYVCGTGFTAFAGATSPDWNANGNATWDAANQAAQLTDTGTFEAGAWVYARAVVVDDVTVQFDFSAGGGTGGDGVALAFETKGPNAVGATGGGLGVSGLGGFGVELDSYDDAECLDATANHTAIDSLVPCGAGEPTSLVVDDSPGFTVADGAWHTVKVHVASGAFTVTADSIPQFSDYAPAGWADGKYWIALAGATGGHTNVHEVRNVSVTFQTPHCY